MTLVYCSCGKRCQGYGGNLLFKCPVCDLAVPEAEFPSLGWRMMGYYWNEQVRAWEKPTVVPGQEAP